LDLCKSFPVFNATRWFSRRACLAALAPALGWFMLFLESLGKEKGWEVGTRLLNDLRDPHLVAMIMVVTDIVLCMDVFSQQMQRDTLTVLDVKQLVEDLHTRLASMIKLGADGKLTYDKQHLGHLHSFICRITIQMVAKRAHGCLLTIRQGVVLSWARLHLLMVFARSVTGVTAWFKKL
jgi:hypothetical protein